MMGRTASAVTVALLVLVAALGGCGGGDDDAGPAQTGSPSASAPATPDGTSAAPTSPAGATPTAPPATTPGGDPAAGWTTGPVTVERQVLAPPLPLFQGIRSAAHPGYDRITFDFAGTLPGYQVRYVDTVTQDGSGETVTMPGRRYLLITLRPAQAHTDSGEPTVRPRRATLDYPMLRGYVITGDFEGVVNVALGLDDVVGFRVGEIPGTPGRVYIDVAA
ncbi:hypothetical protein [Micromonospora sp. NPDC126480]|uniref:AMIN-like domain-containing (lipo)protein n=1 Tax=Micromonospora sp. NPDC126480 TaxID=3155312 RepID=UPI00332BA4C7